MMMIGKYTWKHYRNGILLSEESFLNAIVNQGKNKILDVMFNGLASTDPWYIGLIDSAGFVQLSSTDTLDSHTGWVEATTTTAGADFGGARQAWSVANAVNQQITNSASIASFTIAAPGGTIKGAFICDHVDAITASDRLWSTALSPIGDKVVAAADVITIQFDLSFP